MPVGETSSQQTRQQTSNNMAKKRLSRLAKNGKNDKCFTATKKVQPQTAKKFNFLAAEHDKHETIVALNKICKIITKPHTHTQREENKRLRQRTCRRQRLWGKSGLTVRPGLD